MVRHSIKSTNVSLKTITTVCAVALAVFALMTACGGQTEFVVKDLRETTGKVETQNLRIDNSTGKDTLRKDEKVIKNYRHTINLSLNGRKQVDEGRVREKILDLYKLTPNDDSKVCVVPVEVPAGNRIQYDLEWTESIREGKIVEATSSGEGEQLGTYTVISNFDCQVTGQSAY